MLVVLIYVQYHNSSLTILQAAEKLRITASELCRLQIADGVIPVIILLSLIFGVNYYLLGADHFT